MTEVPTPAASAQPVRIVAVDLSVGDLATLWFKVFIAGIPVGIIVGVIVGLGVLALSIFLGFLGMTIPRH